ncbi:MAG TPA: hypothetical protein VKG45_16660 [Actinomycetes bacterium]|nr:hypothetical protein [Actinomycetes bacterium]
MAAQWIGFEEADQLRELLEGIAGDEHAGSGARTRARSAAGRVAPQMRDEDLADLARLLSAAAGSERLDRTWRSGARYWANQVEGWLRSPD